MEKRYLVLEIQVNENGAVGTLINQYPTYPAAESAFYSVVSAAVVSSLPKHTVMLIDEDGITYERKSYVHGAEALL